MLKKPKFIIRRVAKSTLEERTVSPEVPLKETEQVATPEPTTQISTTVSDTIPTSEQGHPIQSQPLKDGSPGPSSSPPVPGFTLEGASMGH